jgi:hypothetical protein
MHFRVANNIFGRVGLLCEWPSVHNVFNSDLGEISALGASSLAEFEGQVMLIVAVSGLLAEW